MFIQKRVWKRQCGICQYSLNYRVILHTRAYTHTHMDACVYRNYMAANYNPNYQHSYFVFMLK